MNRDRIGEEKARLREMCYARRMSMEASLAAAGSERIAKQIIVEIDAIDNPSHPDLVVSAYWPLPGELDLRPALKVLADRPIQLALPRVIGNEQPLSFHAWHPADHLLEGRFKVMEPEQNKPRLDPTILLVPLLAFDRARQRLGHGKGYYDRTLACLRAANSKTMAIGVAFSIQEVEQVPTDDYDQTLDMVITEHDVLKPDRMI